MPEMIRPKHAKAVAIAMQDYRNKVRESPRGSNTNGRVRDMQSNTWLKGTRWAWCVAACITWCKEAGLQVIYLGAGAYDYHNWATRNGFTVPLAAAVPGDWVVFNVGAGHMAMLREKWTGGEVKTIDGNVSDCVDLRERSHRLVRGGTVIRIPELPVSKPPPVKPPVFEVVTGINGKVVYVSGGRAVGRFMQRFIPRYLRKHPDAPVSIRRKKVKKG